MLGKRIYTKTLPPSKFEIENLLRENAVLIEPLEVIFNPSIGDVFLTDKNFFDGNDYVKLKEIDDGFIKTTIEESKKLLRLKFRVENNEIYIVCYLEHNSYFSNEYENVYEFWNEVFADKKQKNENEYFVDLKYLNNLKKKLSKNKFEKF